MPPIFPDNDIVRNDILDYRVEIEYFDTMVARAIASIETRGELDNAVIVITSDHGMPFPRAKASLYDAGSRVPLVIRWPQGIRKPGRAVNSFVNLSDLQCVVFRNVKVPSGKETTLTFAVNNHPKGNWTLIVRINSDEVLKKSIEESKWKEIRLDLWKHAGKTIKIELENRAGDWSFEVACWNQIELIE